MKDAEINEVVGLAQVTGNTRLIELMAQLVEERRRFKALAEQHGQCAYCEWDCTEGHGPGCEAAA